MDNITKSDILVYCADQKKMFKRARKAFRRIKKSDHPALEHDFRCGEKLLNGNAICGEEFLFLKHEGIILPYRRYEQAQIIRYDEKLTYREPLQPEDKLANIWAILGALLLIALGIWASVSPGPSVYGYGIIPFSVCAFVLIKELFSGIKITTDTVLRTLPAKSKKLDEIATFPMTEIEADPKALMLFNERLKERLLRYHENH